MRRSELVFTKRSFITLGVLALFLAAAYYFFVSKGITYIWHWEKIPEMLFYYGTKAANETKPHLHLGVLMIGFVLTVKISIVAIFFAIILGTIVGIARLSNEPVTKAISIAFVELIRNTPLLVQIYIIYFFAGSLLRLSAFAAGTAALAIFEGAYVGEIVRAGIQSIHKGQMEAARSLGMTYGQAMRHIILPQAFKRIIPPLAGQFISLIKDSSLVSVIALADLMFQGQQAVARTYYAFEIYFTVAFLYLVMTFTLSMATQYIERRLAISD
ncbi:MAG: amino acid ABC transporter permease [Deltaproteobacteria bacterium]|nr:amino acid ABC transporter permease [Deltaproteobacteria bacterium]